MSYTERLDVLAASQTKARATCREKALMDGHVYFALVDLPRGFCRSISPQRGMSQEGFQKGFLFRATQQWDPGVRFLDDLARNLDRRSI